MVVELAKVWLLLGRISVIELTSVAPSVELRTMSDITFPALFSSATAYLTDEKLRYAGL